MAEIEQEHIGSVAMGDIGAIEEAKSIAADINSLLPGEMRQMTFWHNAALKMAAALSRPAQEPVAVKALEWRRPPNVHTNVSIERASSIVGIYEAWGGGGWNRNGGPNTVADNRTLDAAKAAAQADYEQRILSALSTPTPKEESK